MIRLTLLSGSGLSGSDGESIQPVLSQPKRLAVLAYLALAGPGRFRSRDSLLALFWPDATDRKARQALNQTLHFLRRALGGDAIVSRGPGELGVSSDVLWCDATAFDQMIAAGKLADALRLYGGGGLLPGFFADAAPEFDQWLSGERERLRRTAFGAAWKLAESSEQDGQLAAAAEWGRIAAELSLNDETTARRLIQMLDRIGDRSGALQAHDAFARRLAAEYETIPSASLREIVGHIRERKDPVARQDDALDAATPAAASPAVASPAAAISPHVSNGVRTPPGAARGNDRNHRNDGDHRGYWRVGIMAIAILGVISLYRSASVLSGQYAAVDEYRASIVVREFASSDQLGDSLQLERALTSAIVDQLTQVRSFNVVAVPSTALVPRQSASVTAPRIVLAGNVVQSDGRVRVNIQIADAESGRTIKTVVLDHPVGQRVPLADSLSLQVSSLVRAAVGREIRLREWSIGANNKKVYMLMQEADEHRDRANQLTTAGDPAAAVRALRSADSALLQVERDAPRWREPIIERVELLRTLSMIYLMPPLRQPAEVRAALERGILAGQRAVSLGPKDANALEALGSVEYWYWLVVPLPADSAQIARTRAERTLKLAVVADPGRATALSFLSALLYARADYVGAYLTADRAYRADAYLRSPETILDELFLASYEMGDGSMAPKWCNEINRRIRRGSLSAYCGLRLLASSGTKDKHSISRAWQFAMEADDPTARRSAIPPDLEMLVAAVIARQGLRDSAESVIHRAHERGNDDPEVIPAEAEAWMRLGQADSATALLTHYIAGKLAYRAGVVRSRTFVDLPGLHQALTRMSVPLAVRD